MKLGIYTDKSHYVPEFRTRYLTGILKALWNERTVEERRKIYGVRADIFEVVDTIAAADVCLLPMLWNYYLDHNRVEQARQLARMAQNAGKEIIVWSEGDYGVHVPIENAVVFQYTINRARRACREYALAPAFDDNVALYLSGEPCYRPKTERPVVGFCGQAASSPVKQAAWRLHNLWRWGLYRLNLHQYEPPPVQPPVRLRSKVLDMLSRSSLVLTNFVIRDRYRGGAASAQDQSDPFNPIKKAFIDNLNTSDYIVCIRGTGNWSKRFYETLNWGRIPVFIDTDCVLPYDFAVDWKQYCVWVEPHEIPFAAEKVADFHAALSPAAFLDLQQACRNLWLDRLSIDGFYRHFAEHFNVQP
ncbi:MAG: exostosin family protein [Anaerolineae bacterium]|nr:exostosin family protein [Anaerolineae bacterium]